MQLEYKGDYRVKIDRVQPIYKNSCRLSCAANALNYYLGNLTFTPELVHDHINEARAARGERPVDLDLVAVADEEIAEFLDLHGEGIVLKEISGRKCLNPDFLKELISAGFIVDADHQLLYCDPTWRSPNSLDYIPEELRHRLVDIPEFSYQTFLDFQDFIAHYYGDLGNGHVDIVVDLKEVEGVDCIILANLASYGNEYPVAVPWHFYCNYLAYDWGHGRGNFMRDISLLPDEAMLEHIKEVGYLEAGEMEYFHGDFEIYYPQDRAAELNALLARYL